MSPLSVCWWLVCWQVYTKTIEWISTELGWRLDKSRAPFTFGADLEKKKKKKSADPGNSSHFLEHNEKVFCNIFIHSSGSNAYILIKTRHV